MIIIAVAVLWASYGMGFWAWCLLKGYNIGAGQVWSPTRPYGSQAGQTWPPPNAGCNQIIPTGNSADVLTAYATYSSPSTAGSSSSTAAGAAPAGVTGQAAINAAAQKFGWNSGSQWTCLLKLLAYESGGNANALNTTATCSGGDHAYGAFQSCDHGGCGGASCGHDEYCGYGLSVAQTKEANCGNLYYQAIWGMNYIKQEYGSPCNIPGITSGSYSGY